MYLTDALYHNANQYTEGNPLTGVRATLIAAEHLNMITNELNQAVQVNGAASNRADNQQLLTALSQMLESMDPGGRLTLTTALPVTVADVTAATTVRYAPYKHNRVPLWDGTRWVLRTFTELTQLLSDTTKSPAAAVANGLYDLFVWNDAGTVRLSRGPVWTGSSARGTGAGTTELVRQDGKWVNAQAITNGPLANRGLYVGTIRTDGSINAVDSFAKRWVWNCYNRTMRGVRALEATDSWSYSTQTIRQANGSTANQIDVVRGLDEDLLSAVVRVQMVSTVVGDAYVGIGLDSTTAFVTGFINSSLTAIVANGPQVMGCEWKGYPGLGRHAVTWLERGIGSGTQLWVGDSGAPTLQQFGIHGEMLG